MVKYFSTVEFDGGGTSVILLIYLLNYLPWIFLFITLLLVIYDVVKKKLRKITIVYAVIAILLFAVLLSIQRFV